jgi:hypothetical protein
MARSSSLTSVLGELLAKPKSHSVNLCTALLLCFALPDVSMGQDAGGKASDIGLINPEAAAHAFPKRGYSPYAGRNYPTRVFWGDEHRTSSPPSATQSYRQIGSRISGADVDATG